MRDEALRVELIARAMQQQSTAQRLMAQRRTHVGYHPEIEALHAADADFLGRTFERVGWPGRKLVGDDGAAAAMHLLQNSMSRPEVVRRGLELLMGAAEKNEASALDAAYLADRIRVFEGKPQIFGTQLDWGPDGKLAPAPVAEPEGVDRRRAGVGLGPLAAAVAETNAELARTGEGTPVDIAERRAAFEGWATRVGWR